MSRPNPFILIGIVALLCGGYGWLTASVGAFYVSSHEGDTLHMLDIIFRMNSGLSPHLDFVTPLGFLGFAPFALLMEQGYSVGHAIVFGQVAVSVILAPLILYVAYTRLLGWAAYAFAAMMVVFCLALSFGGIGAGLSMSMHYNRWAWSVASLAILIALLPRQGRESRGFDGVLLALLFSILVMIKVTFFVAILPGVVVALWAQGRRRELGVACVSGVFFAVLLIFALGPAFWLAYASDLLNVARSEVRPHTGVPFSDIIGAPRFIAVTIVGFLALHFAARAGLRAQALGLIFLFPGFLFITWQNFGNDPKWLVPLAALLWTLSSFPPVEDHADYRQRFRFLAGMAALLFLPSAMTLATSPIKHAAQNAADYEPMLPPHAAMADIYVRRDRGYSMKAESHFDDPGGSWTQFSDLLDKPEPLAINGISFSACEFRAGSVGWLRTIGADLRDIGVEEGSALFTADILSFFWLYEAYRPLMNGAPWYYGELSGIENADYIVVPKCGFAGRARQIIISDIVEFDLSLETIADTNRVAVFRPIR